MNESELPREGGCRCGQVRFRISAPPLVTAVCHCTECQHMTGSAFSLSAAIPTEAFAVTQGEPVEGGARTPGLSHLHCPHCMSWLFTRMTGMDMFVNVRATLLDQPGEWATPFVETFTNEKLPWVTTPAQHSFSALPPMEAWEGLVQDYQSRAKRATTPPPLAG